MRYYIEVFIFFMFIYCLCYKQVGEKSKYKILFPEKVMKILSFPAKLIKKIPFIKNWIKSDVTEMSIFRGLLCIYITGAFLLTYVFFIFDPTKMDGVCLTGLFLFIYVLTIIKIVYRVIDICIELKALVFKFIIFILWTICSGVALISVLTCEPLLPVYTKFSFIYLCGVFAVVLKISRIYTTKEVEGQKSFSEENLQKRISISKVIVLFLFLLLFVIDYMFYDNYKDGKIEKQEKQTEITLVLDNVSLDQIKPIDEGAIEDSKYKDSIEEALKTRIFSDVEQEYMRNIDEILFQLESDNYVTIYYRSVKNEKLECYTVAKFKKKAFDGVVKYAFLTCTYTEMGSDARVVENFEDNLKNQLISVDYNRNMSVYPGEKRFVWGNTQSEDVFSLKIEGQEPTDIIRYERFGKQWYFWYYEDLKSDKPGNLLDYTVE